MEEKNTHNKIEEIAAQYKRRWLKQLLLQTETVKMKYQK